MFLTEGTGSAGGDTGSRAPCHLLAFAAAVPAPAHSYHLPFIRSKASATRSESSRVPLAIVAVIFE